MASAGSQVPGKASLVNCISLSQRCPPLFLHPVSQAQLVLAWILLHLLRALTEGALCPRALEPISPIALGAAWGSAVLLTCLQVDGFFSTVSSYTAHEG